MHKKQAGKLFAVVFLIAVFGMAFCPQDSLAGVSVDSYCDLAIQSMQQEIPNIQQLIGLVNQYGDDPATLAQEEAIKRDQFDQGKDALFSSYGTTAEEYVTYMGRNGRAVNEYLATNPNIKQQIDDLSAQINSLLEEYESLKESVVSSPPPLP